MNKEDLTTELKDWCVKATKVTAMGIEKDGERCVLYHAKSHLGVHWFAIPEHKSKDFTYEVPAHILIPFLDENPQN